MQCEKHMACIDSSAADDKHCIDYLLFGEHPALPGELMGVVQHGFRSSAEYNSMGLDGAVRLASCINLADQLRIQQQQQLGPNAVAKTGSSNAPGSGLLVGQLLVCKVQLGGALQEAEGQVQLLTKAGERDLRGEDGRVQVAACLDGTPVSQQQYPGMTAVYRTAVAYSGSTVSQQRQVLPQHRVWYVFNPVAVLPEYLITFKYVVTAGQQTDTLSAAAAAANSLNDLAGSNSKQSDPLLRLCAQPLQHWLLMQQQPPSENNNIGALELETLSSSVIPGSNLSADEAVAQQCQAALSAAAAAADNRRLSFSAVTPEALSGFAGGQQLAALTALSLHDCGLTSCWGLLQQLPALTSLVLSFNKLTTLDGLCEPAGQQHTLSQLDVSHNLLSYWQASWLAGCSKLTMLDASYNQLANLAHVDELVRYASLLVEVNLSWNPITQHKAYQLQLLRHLPDLQRLDGKTVAAGGNPNQTKLEDLIRQGAIQWHSDTGPVPKLPAGNTADLHPTQHQIFSLVVESRGLDSLAGVGAAHNLVCASFADNLLGSATGLEGCSQLQQLNLSSNLISELSPLSGLRSLRQLDVSLNHISSLTALMPLTALCQLSVEGNMLTSLAFVTALVNLLELYAANNAVADIKVGSKKRMLLLQN
eukprot:GHRR01021351.1.p1 GENE.GHRR01021351.1~~GHRR01021351.1.p1  ORF type:complete len:647 (+),score=280.15 GHRR01021351.1:1761-3701(+)